MRILFILSLVLFFEQGFAQDDMPDYRSKRDNFTKMQEKDIRSDLASFTMAGIDESMGKPPLKTIPFTSFGKDSITFSGNSTLNNTLVTIKTGVFDPSKHKLGYSDKYLVKIDNKGFYGDYGKMPKTTIASITVIMSGDTISIPPAAYSDLYNPILTYSDGSGTIKSNNNVYVSGDNRKLYVYMLKREEGGSYEVTWVIQDKKYLRRVVDVGFLK